MKATADERLERLERLARATANVGPTPGFTERVMAAVQNVSQTVEWWTGLPRVAVRVLPVLAVAAVVALVLVWRSSRDLDDAVTTSVNAVEIEW